MLKEYEQLIATLNKNCQPTIGRNFKLYKRESGNEFEVYRNQGTLKAINRLDGGLDKEVSVNHWFNDYYLFFEVKYLFYNSVKKRKPTRELNQCSISISVFKSIGEQIIQLFRAEWDDYNDGQTLHPQPHWHITSDTSIANTYQEYAKEYGDDGFMSILEPEKNKISSLKRFHFAMRGQWEDCMSHVTPIESCEQVSNWVSGLLSSIRSELLYIDGSK